MGLFAQLNILLNISSEPGKELSEKTILPEIENGFGHLAMPKTVSICYFKTSPEILLFVRFLCYVVVPNTVSRHWF